VATGTARQEVSEPVIGDSGMGPVFGTAGAAAGGLVVLRDEVGILSVMRCLDLELTLDPGFQYAFPAESAALVGLSDPRLAPPLSYVVDAAGQIVATVCRHVTGVRLSKILAQLPRGLDVQTAATVAKDVLAALDALHARGVPHRAPDPDHVIIEPNGTCVLVDAGLVSRPGAADPGTDPGAALAADLALAAELFVTCLVTGRRLPDQRAHKGYFAPGELEGVAARLYRVLTESEPDPDPDPQDAGAATPPTMAALLYQELEAAAEDCFDAGWDGRGRERLAAAAKDHRSSRRRVLEFRPSTHTDRRWSIRGWHAGSPRVGRNRQRLAASAAVMRQARAQLVELWAGGARGDRRGAGSHAAGSNGVPGVVRYLIPLIAFLLAFGLALLFLGSGSPSPARTTMSPALATQPTAAALGNAQDGLPRTRPGSTVLMNTVPLTVNTSPYTPPAAGASPAPVTKITVLDVVSLAYDAQQPGKAVATVDVQTSGTAPVTVTVTFSPAYGTYPPPYSGARTDSFALSGKTSYTVTDTAYMPAFCQYPHQGRVLAGTVEVAGHVNSTPATVLSASGDLYGC
jgi:serine/threonine protein kinase